ncbi:Nucleolar protein 12 (25kDa) family protein [Candida parapsilosis]|uniref:Ribosomal RNA-processing protein 17 n=2 Tax=Candida parapsilosis TaxID=5480 RepID=G8BD57_CANPC|nr:uncharacterized protein CPAR2_208470 [Candida parapsilosis]KAF6054647.1 Nucleolar protein 12 (25kDa) family protein [Candida parapsilosis]KAF6056327.1 Nucleolar protein 12 (25kDa) family protein [Candida parapsilosis]KAF6059260.1 Nucleolar protein 12 (25kDa) family protein [Candida parapsilosis]KAF6068017.1 Nucleolar protein 12 (25kDa) family protein [Candida parapsilosis]KAI5905283.1 Ribosomal RNA-processing protein 17 [Candida parapsilosis]
MVRQNRQILTAGKNYAEKQAKKHAVNEVTFDKESREEYLTGFHKRKLQRKKKAQEYIKEQERLARIEERKQLRDERKRDLENQLREFNEKAKELAMINGGLADDDSEGDGEEKAEEDEWTGFDEEATEETSTENKSVSLKGILHHKEVYEPDSNLDGFGDETTVTIESIDKPLGHHANGTNLEQIAKTNNVDLNKSEEVLEEAVERAKNYAVLCGVAKPSKVEKPKAKKKKFRYLSKAERRENTRKEKLKGKLRGKR